jgi:putative tricarboxylic transport membrane protein
MFQVGEVVVIGFVGYVLLRLGFHPAPILLGFVLGPRFEENFRRAMLISRGDLGTFIERPISAVFVAMCVILIGAQLYFRLRPAKGKKPLLNEIDDVVAPDGVVSEGLVPERLPARNL